METGDNPTNHWCLDQGFFKITEQYASGVLGFSSQYGNDNTISYTSCNICGKPTVFPSYGDFTQTFAVRNYGSWRSYCFTRCTTSNDFHVVSQDFIDVTFDRSVYPFRVDIYETYNPGAVVRILAQDEDKKRWSLLWSGLPQSVRPASRIFSPPLRRINFRTSVLRLEFYHHHLTYHFEVDALRLVGSELISFFKHSMLSDSMDTHQKKDEVETRLDHLPGELLTTIFSFLDLESLCHCACVSRLFRKFSYDPSLYRHLNLQPYWHKVSSRTLQGLAERCSLLKNLTLSWCTAIEPAVFVWFLEICGQTLHSIHLACCIFLTNDCLKGVADFCPQLEELDLQSVSLDQLAFIQISRITRLRHLDFYRTPIDTSSLTHILRSCFNLEFLGLGACLTEGDLAAAEIKTYGRSLRSLDLWRAKSLSAFGVCALAEGCCSLEMLDLGWCLEVDAGSGCLRELISRCPQLKALLLTSIRTLSDADILAIACHCQHLQLLDVLGNREISCDSLFRVLCQCTELKMLDVSFCGQIEEGTVEQWRAAFPSVDIKRSYQKHLSRNNIF